MTPLFAAILVAHALIHLMGVAKAFRLAELPQLTHTISPAMGLVWLGAALLLLAAAGALFVWPRWWWMVGALALVLSQVAIVTSWSDARFGTILNGVVLIGVVFGYLAQGPGSLRRAYDADVERGLARQVADRLVTNDDLAHLPPLVRQHLLQSGVVGQPRVRNFRARMHGRIRSGPDAPWMPFAAEQHNFYDRPTRLFYMTASRMLVPFQGFHRYVANEATMLVKLVAMVPVANASGAEMTQAETVTMFNDMCLMAPATLIDPAIAWEQTGDRAVRARFTNAGYTIQADLSFNDAGELTNFLSDDRRQTATDGVTMRQVRWSTPLGRYRSFGPVRIGSRGEARWHEPAGDYAYIEMDIDDVQYNVRP